MALAYDKVNRSEETLKAYQEFVEYVPPEHEKATG